MSSTVKKSVYQIATCGLLLLSSCVTYQSTHLKTEDNLQIQNTKYVTTERITCNTSKIPLYYYVDSILNSKYGRHYYANNIRVDYKTISFLALKSTSINYILFDVYYMDKLDDSKLISEHKRDSLQTPKSVAVKTSEAVNKPNEPAKPAVKNINEDSLINTLPKNIEWLFNDFNGYSYEYEKIAGAFNNVKESDLVPFIIKSKLKYKSELKFLGMIILSKSNYTFECPKKAKATLDKLSQQPTVITKKTELRTLKNLTSRDISNLGLIYHMMGSMADDN